MNFQGLTTVNSATHQVCVPIWNFSNPFFFFIFSFWINGISLIDSIHKLYSHETKCTGEQHLWPLQEYLLILSYVSFCFPFFFGWGGVFWDISFAFFFPTGVSFCNIFTTIDEFHLFVLVVKLNLHRWRKLLEQRGGNDNHDHKSNIATDPKKKKKSNIEIFGIPGILIFVLICLSLCACFFKRRTNRHTVLPKNGYSSKYIKYFK